VALRKPQNRVRDGVEDRGLQGLELLEPPAALLLGRDVHGVAQDGPPSLVLDGRDGLHDPAGLPVLRDDAVLVGDRPVPLEHRDRLLEDRLAVLGVDDVDASHADHLVGGEPREQGGLFVEKVEAPVEDDVDAGMGTLRQDFVELAGLGRFDAGRRFAGFELLPEGLDFLDELLFRFLAGNGHLFSREDRFRVRLGHRKRCGWGTRKRANTLPRNAPATAPERVLLSARNPAEKFDFTAMRA